MGGLSSARNAGLDIATGEYISFIDSDDYISADFIEKLYCTLNANSADIVQCNFSRDKLDISRKESNVEILTSDQAIERLNNIKYYTDFVIVCNKLYRSYIYKNIRFPVGKINEDAFVTYLAFDKCQKIALISDKMYYYRINPNSIMQKSFSIKRYDALIAYENEIKYFKDNSKDNSYKSALVLYQHMLKSMYILTYKYIEENRKQNLDMLLKKINSNMKNYLKYNNDSVKEKIKHIVFYCFPNFYCAFTTYIVDKLKYMCRKIRKGVNYDT